MPSVDAAHQPINAAPIDLHAKDVGLQELNQY